MTTVPPTGSSSGSTTPDVSNTVKSLSDTNFQNFLQLLTTQLKNQDPTNPTDTNGLTQEIASLSQVEQQTETNSNLQSLITLITNGQTSSTTSNNTLNTNLQSLLAAFGTNQYSGMASDIGKEIDATGNSILVSGGQGVMAYNLPANASNATVTITDSTGKTVFTAAGPTVSGRNEVAWGGLETDGSQAPDGVYHFSVTAKDASGKALTATTYTTGIVTSADNSNGTTSLSIGNISVPFSSIVSIRQPATVANDNSSSNSNASSNS